MDGIAQVGQEFARHGLGGAGDFLAGFEGDNDCFFHENSFPLQKKAFFL